MAVIHLRSFGFPISKGAAAHGESQKCLTNAGNPDVAAFAAQLGDLHTERNRADYQMERRDVEQTAKAALIARQAGDMIRTLDAAFASARRSQLQAAIAEWRRANGYPG